MGPHRSSDPVFIRPRYGEASFAEIPDFVEHLLTGQGASPLRPEGWRAANHRFTRVITLFIDAFGWRFFERFQEHPLIRRFARQEASPGSPRSFLPPPARM